MKLRIRGDSLRLRLTQSEIVALGRNEIVESIVRFGPAPSERLTYSLKCSAEIKRVEASYLDNRITIVLPRDAAREWIETDKVGINEEQLLGDGGALRILVEKDFSCSTPRQGEDDHDAFPHP